VGARLGGGGSGGGQGGTRALSLTTRLGGGLSALVYVFLHNPALADGALKGLLPCPAVPAILSVEDDESEPV